MIFTELLPPAITDDAGRDVDERLLSACRRMLDEVGDLGFDFLPSYADLLAAVDAKEWARNEAAKEQVRS